MKRSSDRQIPKFVFFLWSELVSFKKSNTIYTQDFTAFRENHPPSYKKCTVAATRKTHFSSPLIIWSAEPQDCYHADQRQIPYHGLRCIHAESLRTWTERTYFSRWFQTLVRGHVRSLKWERNPPHGLQRGLAEELRPRRLSVYRDRGPPFHAKRSQAFLPSGSSFLLFLHPHLKRFSSLTFSSLQYNIEVAKCHYVLEEKTAS